MLQIFFVLVTIASAQPAIEEKVSINVVEETQHAICKIATEEIQATANASITRQLKGVCNTNDLHEKLRELEARIISTIKELLYHQQHQQRSDLDITLTQQSQHEDLDQSSKYLYKNFGDSNVLPEEKLMTTVAPPPLPPPASSVKSDEMDKKSEEKVREIDLEILKRNNSIIDGEFGRTFVFYWRIEDVQKTLLEKDLFLNSPHFFIKGVINYIKFSPHHLNSKYCGFEFENFVPMLYKYRFVVLNQNYAKGDLSSQLLGKIASFAKMFRISYEKLNKYIANDSIIIKLLVYLDM